MEGHQSGCSWAPATPAKPNSTNQQLMGTNWEEKNNHLLVQGNWGESYRCTNLSESRTLLPGECFNSGHLVEDVSGDPSNWQAKMVASSIFAGEDVSFGHLLALAQAGAATATTSAMHFHPTTMMTSFGHPSLQEQETLPAETTGIIIPDVFTGGNSVPSSRPAIDLNSLPTVTDIPDAASSKSKLSRFEPITPNKNNQEGYLMSIRQDFSPDEVCAGKDQQENKITRSRRGRREKTQMVNNLMSAAASTEPQENNKPDKSGKDDIDFIKAPQQKTRRKKHRPKVVIEGKGKRTPKSSAGKSNVSQDSTRVKRKYVRRKGVNNVLEDQKGINIPEGSRDNGTTGIASPGPSRYTRSSCRRSLNFNLESLEKDGNSMRCAPANRNGGSPAENCDTIDQSIVNVDTAHQPDFYVNPVHEVSEQGFDVKPSPSKNIYPLKYSAVADKIVTRDKCQIVFSEETHDKEVDIVRIRMNSDVHRKRKNDLISSSTYSTLESQKSTATAEAEVCNKFRTGTDKKSLQIYLPLSSHNALYLPPTCKKRRTKRHNMVISSLQYKASTECNRAKLEVHTPRDSGTNEFTSTAHTSNYTQNGGQVVDKQLFWGPPERIRKPRSRGRKQLRDLSSLLKFHKLPAPLARAEVKSRNQRGLDNIHEPKRCMELNVAGICSTIMKKKRSKSMRVNSIMQYGHQQLSTLVRGPSLALTWKCMPSADSIMAQLNRLDLNAESIQWLSQNHNIFTENRTHYQEKHALVPYQRYGAIVPHDGSFDEVRRRQPKPKVDLDDETTRVWKLLLENINSEGIDGTDDENTKRWEEERRVFNGRADSFIARMRLVQGDRHFSPWKGSVVDSVVGVFLTQNVSDHLSSSAFMSLVAQYPVDSKTYPSNLPEEKLGSLFRQAEVWDVDPGGASSSKKEVLNQSVYVDSKSHPSVMHEDQLGSKIKEPQVHDMEPGGVTSEQNKEILNQTVYVEDTDSLLDYDNMRQVDGFNSFESVINDSLRGPSTESSKCGPFMYNETVANKSGSSIEEGRDIVDTFSSLKSTYTTSKQTTGRSDCCSVSSISEEHISEAESNRFTSSISFGKLLQRADSILNGVYEGEEDWQGESERLPLNFQNWDRLDKSILFRTPNLGGKSSQDNVSQKTSTLLESSSVIKLCASENIRLSTESASQMSQKITADCFFEGPKFSSSNASSRKNNQVEIDLTGQEPEQGLFQGNNFRKQDSEVPIFQQNMTDVGGYNTNLDNAKISEHKDVNSDNKNQDDHPGKTVNGPKAKRGRTKKTKEKQVEWNRLRNEALTVAGERMRTDRTMDSVDWDAVRCADVNDIAQTIKERGMNNMLAQRIKNFLNRLVRDHGSIDLEWLRDVPPDQAKEYLLSIKGLGLKSVECVRLLTLHHVAFPVDTNVGRIAVRLGWVPLQPLPESLQLHLLEMYPVLESIQKYLWPRLCKLNQGTLYELHYQMITFGKVFCTKSRPNCNACPMRGECRHFASAFASSRLALPAPEEKRVISSTENRTGYHNPTECMNTLHLPTLQAIQMDFKYGAAQPIIEEPATPEPIIEVPATPEPVYEQDVEGTIESAFNEELDEIPTIQLNIEEFTHNLQEIMQQNSGVHVGDTSKALVALTSDAASLPEPRLKNANRLRTEHRVYELPDSHPLLEKMDKREPDDPCPYLLAIWTPGETVDSIEPPERQCSSQGLDTLCTDETCSSCNSIREANSQTVRGTLLIPCRTAMRGSFPLNGTYFQVNEVFSDHESSLLPLDVPRAWLWSLPRRTVFFGTSIPTIFKGLSTEGIQYCFWRGFVCVRGFDRKTRAPRPLVARLHFPASRMRRRKGNMDEE
ncbi:transcriptional activator DEMETER-like [Andrographis paniculata]|uniref:transcriptional activator DEMETER-like n=1 Tax=Andrographis paniculata TaxID=175694 RepID=UPI0021E965BC|nr:transcriptional activator DEMETER-like [Andrographis paniculata]